MNEGKFQYAGEPPEVEVEGFGIEEAKGLRSLMVRFMKEYEKKPEDQSDQEWLKQRFLDEMPEMDEAEAERLSQETVETVSQYNKNLSSLKEAREKGKTTEEWFAEKSFEAAAGMSATAFGQRMMVLDDALSAANAYIKFHFMPEMYFSENLIKAAAAAEKVCAFFHTSTVLDSKGGDRGIKRSPS